MQYINRYEEVSCTIDCLNSPALEAHSEAGDPPALKLLTPAKQLGYVISCMKWTDTKHPLQPHVIQGWLPLVCECPILMGSTRALGHPVLSSLKKGRIGAVYCSADSTIVSFVPGITKSKRMDNGTRAAFACLSV